MDKKMDLSELGNEVVEPQSPKRKTTLKSVVSEDNDNEPMTAKQVNALSQDIKRLADMVADMSSVLLKEDGTLVDLSDKLGRERLAKSVKLNTELGVKMMKAIPSAVTAELCENDRNLMGKFYKDRKAYARTLNAPHDTLFEPPLNDNAQMTGGMDFKGVKIVLEDLAANGEKSGFAEVMDCWRVHDYAA